MVQRHNQHLLDVVDTLSEIEEQAAELVESQPEPPQPGLARRIDTKVPIERIIAINESL
jgi:hypothetical protein